MIKFDKIIETPEYRKRIISYMSLPVRESVTKDELDNYMEFLKLTNPKKYVKVISLVENDFKLESIAQGTDTPDFSLRHILDTAAEVFIDTPQWKEFVDTDYSDILAGYDGITNIHGFYKKENDGKHLVSVDLAAANWQSMQSIIGFDDTYEEFIVKHTDRLMPPNSKKLRTKITGILGAQKIMFYNQKLLKDNKDEILETLFLETGIDLRNKELFAFYADEFIIEIDEETRNLFTTLDLTKLEEIIFDKVGIKVHLTSFTLKWLDIGKGCIKVTNGNEFEIINMSKDTLLIVNKLLLGLELKDIDFSGVKLKGKTQEEFVDSLEYGLKLMKEIQ